MKKKIVFLMILGVLFSRTLLCASVSGLDLKSILSNTEEEFLPDAEELEETAKKSSVKVPDFKRSGEEEVVEEEKKPASLEEDLSHLSKIERMFYHYSSEDYFSPYYGPMALVSGNVFALEDKKENFSKTLQKGEKKDPLMQFGYDLFLKGSELSFFVKGVSPRPSYVLGPGDKLIIYIWGKLEQTIQTRVDLNGKIYIPAIGHIPLLGVKFGDAERVIKKHLSQKYVNFEVSVSMREVRTIKVYVLGDIKKPGSYEMNTMGTVFHALYAAGGPTKTGSLRSIKLIRNNKVKERFDLYNYLLFGDKRGDVTLRDNDTVFVSSIGKVAQVSGEVKREGIYEFKKKTTAYDLLNYAGGLSAGAYFNRIQVMRVIKGASRVVQDLFIRDGDHLKEDLRSFEIKDGDAIRIFPVLSELKETVYLEGNVRRPGQFGFEKNLSLAKLIQKGDGLKERTYMSRVDIYRYVSEKKRRVLRVDLGTKEGAATLLHDRDVVKLYSQAEMSEKELVFIEGEVIHPGVYEFMENMRVSDLVFMSKLKDFSNRENVEVFRRETEKDPVVLSVNLDAILKHPGSEEDVFLKKNDHVIIKGQKESEQKNYVTVEGEVKYPGVYLVRKEDVLSDLIMRAGGYTGKAFLKGAIFTRESVKLREKKGQLKVMDDEKKRFIYDQRHLGSMSQDAETSYKVILEARKESLLMMEQQLGDTEGRVVVNLEPNGGLKGSRYDLALKDGDKLAIPEIPDSIYIIGGVQNPTSILYSEKERKKNYYINRVGGYSDYADKSHVLIFKSNGTVAKSSARLEKGDIIYVPEKVKISVNILKFLTNITSIISNAVTVVFLVQSLGK